MSRRITVKPHTTTSGVKKKAHHRVVGGAKGTGIYGPEDLGELAAITQKQIHTGCAVDFGKQESVNGNADYVQYYPNNPING